jgi:hypothetical protein
MLHPLYLLPLVALSFGCTRAGSSAAVVPGGGQGAVTVHDHLGWPYQLQDVRVTVDGAPVYGADQSGSGAMASLSPGEHTVLIDARYRYASPGKECSLDLHVTSAIQSTAGSEGIVVHLYRRDMTSNFERGVDVALFVGGTQQTSVSPARVAGEPACVGVGPLVHDEDWTEAEQSAERRRLDYERTTVAAPPR